MSGATDTSTAADRLRFCNAIEGGGPALHLQAAAEAVALCTARLPDSTAALLGLDGGTYAQAVARLRSRWADGRAGH